MTIPFGVDPESGREVYLEEAIALRERGINLKGRIFCPHCGWKLEVRVGEDIQCFTHWREFDELPEETKGCDLRSQHWGAELEQERMISPVDHAITKQKLRFAVRPDPYDLSRLKLYGVMLKPTWNEWDNWPVESPEIRTEGCLRDPSREDFHPKPSQPRVEIELDPGHHGPYIVNIQGASREFNGRWSGELSPSAVFVGTDTFAELRDTRERDGENILLPSRLQEGESIFLPDSSRLADFSSSTLQLGARTYRMIRLTADNIDKLGRIAGRDIIDIAAFHVRVISPGDHPPDQLDDILVRPGGRVYLHVIPPESIDPIIKVIEIPARIGQVVTLNPNHGEPRTFSFIVYDTRRFSIYWGSRHVFIQAVATRDPLDTIEPPSIDVGIQLSTNGTPPQRRSASPNTPMLEFQCEYGSTILKDGWSLFGPKGIRADIKGTFKDSRGQVKKRFVTGILDEEFGKKMEAWILEGASEMLVSFGLLGTVRLIRRSTVTAESEPTTEPPRPAPIPEPEIKEKGRIRTREERRKERESFEKRIVDLTRRESPSKKEGGPDSRINYSSWSFVRQVLDLPESTPHHEVRGGTKKMIRKIVRKLRNDGALN